MCKNYKKKYYTIIKYLYSKGTFKQGNCRLKRACIIDVRSMDWANVSLMFHESSSLILNNNDFEKELDDV